ncbi:hypothetical protein BDQ12DRAFT_690085 [Crucibulum laeve]|uniref:Uncharacterized protein n=1 Tax=Crucibulum laeve TaxID=68775 RepID=A0A5C3LMV2_9AGAR|nr:hypothetical protein BDQ12DRAFT_690085 [Crucibulum laeve]
MQNCVDRVGDVVIRLAGITGEHAVLSLGLRTIRLSHKEQMELGHTLAEVTFSFSASPVHRASNGPTEQEIRIRSCLKLASTRCVSVHLVPIHYLLALSCLVMLAHVFVIQPHCLIQLLRHMANSDCTLETN